MPHISFKIKAESISTFGTNELIKLLSTNVGLGLASNVGPALVEMHNADVGNRC